MDEWDDSAKGKSTGDQRVDVHQLALITWERRRFIAKVTGIFIAIGLLIALLSPIEYQAEATLLPEQSSSLPGNAGSLLQQYGGLIGLGSSSIELQQGKTIPPTLYPTIVNSLPYQLELLNKRIAFTRYDTTATVYTFFDDIYTPSLWSSLADYTLGLPGKIGEAFSSGKAEASLPRGFPADSIFYVNKHQLDIVNQMRNRISVELDDKKGVIHLVVEMPDPNAVAQVGQFSINLLKEYIKNYRIEKASQYLKFVQEQSAKAKDEFEGVQNSLAAFTDQHLNLQTAKAKTQQERLQSQYDLAFNKYNSLAQKVEEAKLKVQENTPVVTVLQPVQKPADNYKPKRKLIVIFSLILGLLLSAGYVIVKALRKPGQPQPQ